MADVIAISCVDWCYAHFLLYIIIMADVIANCFDVYYNYGWCFCQMFVMVHVEPC